MDDAAEGVRPRVPGRGLPRNARARRGARLAEVGDVVPGEPGPRPPDRDRSRPALRRVEREPRRTARRRRGDRAADGGRRSTGGRDPRPGGNGGRDRRGRQRPGRGADVRRPRAGRDAVGCRPGARGRCRRGARSARSGLARRGPCRRPGRDRDPRQRGAVPSRLAPARSARLADGRRRPRQGRDRRRRAGARARLRRRLGAGVARRRARRRRRSRPRRARGRDDDRGCPRRHGRRSPRGRRDHAVRLDRARDPGSRDSTRRDRAGRTSSICRK